MLKLWKKDVCPHVHMGHLSLKLNKASSDEKMDSYDT